jgi:ABC-type phosphate transport system permease subunit
MSERRTRAVIYFAIAASLIGLILESVAVILVGARAPSWSHWLCSPASIHSASHAELGGGLGSALNSALKVLAVHWPHLVPIPLGIATLVYLYRANARYHTNQPAGTQPSSA